mgnify:CR=1 FL=1
MSCRETLPAMLFVHTVQKRNKHLIFGKMARNSGIDMVEIVSLNSARTFVPRPETAPGFACLADRVKKKPQAQISQPAQISATAQAKSEQFRRIVQNAVPTVEQCRPAAETLLFNSSGTPGYEP